MNQLYYRSCLGLAGSGFHGFRKKILLANAAGGLKQLPEPGQPLEIQFTHTLYQDATGTAAALAFEKMGVDRVKTTSVIVVDHKTLQVGYIDGDDHRYLETFSKKYGCWFSRGGLGICHSVFLEDFATPGKSVIGSDSHTTNAGGMGMLALGAGVELHCARLAGVRTS